MFREMSREMFREIEAMGDLLLSTPKLWPWAESLDALVAAPSHHQLLLEDERIRVLHTRIPVGDVVPLHTHRWGGVSYVLSFSHFIRRDEAGEIVFDSRAAGEPPKIPCAQWSQPLAAHTVENLGECEISVILIELKGL